MGALCHKHPDQGFYSLAFQKDNQNGIQNALFQRFPKIGQIVKSLQPDYPKSWKIDKKQWTQLQNFKCYLGKAKAKIWSGCGIMIYLNEGFYYIGMWVNSQRSGLGILIDENGSHYKGQWNKDEPHGYGQYYDVENKRCYKGKWRRGKKHGKGEQTYPDGTRFQGQFQDDVKKGKGKFIFENGCFFMGIFDKDMAVNFGAQKGINYYYQGNWKDSDMNGAAKVSYYAANGDIQETYIGQFQNGQKHGYGQYKWKNDAVYKGQWDRGGIKNKGVYMDPHA